MERLDGNAIAGMLSELFVPEMTAARCRCATCGRVERLVPGFPARRLREPLHDRETEPASFRLGARLRERVEEGRYEVVRNPGTVVAHCGHEGRALVADPHAIRRPAVPASVLEVVDQDLIRVVAIGARDDVAVGVDRDLALEAELHRDVTGRL